MELLKLFKTQPPKVEEQQKKDTPKWELQADCVIIHAFKVKDVQYYCLEDSFNTFTQRAFAALQVYDEWNNRMTHEWQLAWITAQSSMFSFQNLIFLN